jgi:hypothetical protein
MILLITAAVAALAVAALTLLRRRNEFPDLQRRDRALERLRTINPHWVPPAPRATVVSAPRLFDDVEETSLTTGR